MNAGEAIRWHQRVMTQRTIREPVRLSAPDAALLIGMLYRRFERDSDEVTWALDVLTDGSKEFRECR